MIHRRKAYYLLGVLLAILLSALAITTHSAPADTLPLTPIPGRLPNARYPGVYTFEDFNNVNPRFSAVVGGHRNFNWDEINPAPGYYNWELIDTWIDQQVALGKKVGFAVNTYKGADSGGDVTPAWVYEAHPNAHIFCYDEFSVPKYWDPDWQAAYRTFLQALGQRYNGDPRVAFIEVSTGVYGEARPVESGLNNCVRDHGLTSDLWVQTVKRILDMYRDAFPDTPLLFQMGHFLRWSERKETSDYAAEKGIGLKWNLLLADTGNAIFSEEDGCTRDNSCGAGWAELMWRWWAHVPIAFEGYNYYFDDASGQFIWGVYNALDKHADYLVLNSGITANSDYQDELLFAHKYLGRTPGDTPSVWVALRDSDPHNPRIYSPRLRQHTNFSFWLYQDDSVPGGKTVAEFNVGPQPEGRFTRRTDERTGNPCMYFKVDDAYFHNGPPGVTIRVTYYDRGRDTWELQYDARDYIYRSAGIVRKQNSGKWVTRTFVLDDAILANRQTGGSDFRICSRNDGDEYIHFVEVIRNERAQPSPTPLPTATPTPTAGTQTPTPTPRPSVHTLILQHGVDGYRGGADTYMDVKVPTHNFGRAQVLAVDTFGGKRTLIRFGNLPQLPPGATLIGAELSLYYITREPWWSTGWVRAYDLYKPWEELEATWLQAANGRPWAKGGAEDTTYDRAPHLTDDVWIGPQYRWYELDLTPLVKRWMAHPETNRGVLLKGWILGNKSLYMEFASNQYPDPSKRPRLILYYTMPTPTPTPCPGGVCATPTPTFTATATRTWTPITPGAPTFTPTPTPTRTPTPTLTPTPTPTPTPTTIILQNGSDPGTGRVYQGAQDTYIERWNPDVNYGADMALSLRRDVRKTLLRFDTQLIPYHATVWHAELRLWVINRSNSEPIQISAFPLRRGWEEMEATWRTARRGEPWSEPGAEGVEDRIPHAVTQQTVEIGGGWIALDLTPLVQQWVRDPQSNQGVLLEVTGGGPGYYNIFSSNAPTLDLRPQLVITYAADPGERATPTSTPSPTASPTFTFTPSPTRSSVEELTLYEGATVAGQPYTVDDTYLSRWEPSQAYGGERILLLRSGYVRVALLRFPLQLIPRQAIVQEATLHLYHTTRDRGLPLTLRAYALRRAWDEAGATWQSTGRGPWDEPGAQGAGDRAPNPAAEVVIDQTRGWTQLDVTALVQEWVRDPEMNQGLLLEGASSGGVQYTFLSSEWNDPAQRPRLVIRYTVPTPTPTPTPSPTFTPTPTPTWTPTFTPTPTPTWTATFTPTRPATPSPTATLPPMTPTPPLPTPTPGPKHLYVPVRVTPVVIDGVLDEWKGAPVAYLSSDSADTVFRQRPAPSDLSGWLWSAWDGEYLYFAAHIVDDVLVGQDSIDVWRDDGVEFAVNGTPGQAGEGFHQITLVVDGRATDFGSRVLPAGVRHAVRPVPGGYLVELAIPWPVLHVLTPDPERELLFTWGIHDDDDGGDWDTYLIWAGYSTIDPDADHAPLTLLPGTVPPTATPTPSSTPSPTPTHPVQEAVFQDGMGSYTGTRDTTLDRWQHTLSLGREAHLYVRTLEGASLLLRFEGLSLPAQAQVERAVLELFLMQRSSDQPVTLDAYMMRRPWQEETATWEQADAGTPWDVPGARGTRDRGALLGQVSVQRRAGWVAVDVTEAVRAWQAHPDQNWGILLEAHGDSPVTLMFPSREWLSAKVRPRLRILWR